MSNAICCYGFNFASMAFKNQQHFIESLEKAGELLRINAYVNPHLEIAEITDRMSKQSGGGKALCYLKTPAMNFQY
jgi:4-hydroxy-3-polyprenylbenzoate decarboxylase